MPTLRMKMAGRRQMVMVSFDEVHAFLKANCPKEKITIERVVDYTKSLDQARATALHRNGVHLFMATVSIGKGIYVPTGFIVCQRALQSKNSGIKFSLHPDAKEVHLVHALVKAEAPGPCKAIEANMAD